MTERFTPKMLAQMDRLNDVQAATGLGAWVWSLAQGRQSRLRVQQGAQAPRDLFRDMRLRPGVGYGGGDFGLGPDFVVFTAEGRLYRQSLQAGLPRPITPAFGGWAAPTVSPDGTWVLAVHTYEDKDVLAGVPADGSQWPGILAQGADFYMQPAWHPQMRFVAWVEWDFPQMPWDGTRLMLARWDQGRLHSPRHLAGDADTPVFQPTFSPDGRYLAYLTAQGEWDALVLHDLETGQTRTLVEGTALIPPAWAQGMRAYTWLDDQRLVLLENQAGRAHILLVHLTDGVQRRTPQDYTWLRQPAALGPRQVAFLASSPQIPERLVVWDPETDRWTVLARTATESLPREALPQVQPLTWEGPEGFRLHALYYPPCCNRWGTPPPAVVSIHGGPTSQRVWNFNPQAALFTGLGYAYVELNYRGSTGYGRRYMKALYGRWGEVDVEDAVSLARHLAQTGLADPKRLAIMGGSAGGYTVLNVLIRYPEVYQVGIALYPVTDLFALAQDTHKFERRYLDTLIGPLPQAAARYRAWSPLFHAQEIRTPLALFQGEDDKVVPPDQADRLAQALQQRGVPLLYRRYPGEGHGFRQPETLEDMHRQIERFLAVHLLWG